MIVTIKHKGLAALYNKGESKGLSQKDVKWIKAVLIALDAAEAPEDLSLHGLGLHPLKGDRKGYWAVWATKNYRIIFRFQDRAIHDLDLEDYH